MTQRYNVPANHTATFSEILTENFSHSSQICCGISNAADRRPQTADRRPQTASISYHHSRLFAGTPTQLIISAQDLYTGVFVYSITINGKIVASKKFIIIK